MIGVKSISREGAEPNYETQRVLCETFEICAKICLNFFFLSRLPRKFARSFKKNKVSNSSCSLLTKRAVLCGSQLHSAPRPERQFAVLSTFVAK